MASADGTSLSDAAQELLEPAWQMRWRVPELALVLSDRAVAEARKNGDRALRLRAEALALFATNRLGLGVSATARAIAAVRDAERAGDDEIATELKVELACCARSAGSHEVALRTLCPVLRRQRIKPTLRAHALIEFAAALPAQRRDSERTEALDEAERLYGAASELNRDTSRLLQARVSTARAGHHRRHSEFAAAAEAVDTGLALLERLGDPAAESGDIYACLVLEQVHALLELGRRDDAVEAAQPVLRQPVRAAAAEPSGWLRLALATRVHLAEGEPGAAVLLLNDAVAAAERHKLDHLQSETLNSLSHVYETGEEFVEALTCLRRAYAADRRWRAAVQAARIRLLEEFPALAQDAASQEEQRQPRERAQRREQTQRRERPGEQVRGRERAAEEAPLRERAADLREQLAEQVLRRERAAERRESVAEQGPPRERVAERPEPVPEQVQRRERAAERPEQIPRRERTTERREPAAEQAQPRQRRRAQEQPQQGEQRQARRAQPRAAGMPQEQIRAQEQARQERPPGQEPPRRRAEPREQEPPRERPAEQAPPPNAPPPNAPPPSAPPPSAPSAGAQSPASETPDLAPYRFADDSVRDAARRLMETLTSQGDEARPSDPLGAEPQQPSPSRRRAVAEPPDPDLSRSWSSYALADEASFGDRQSGGYEFDYASSEYPSPRADPTYSEVQPYMARYDADASSGVPGTPPDRGDPGLPRYDFPDQDDVRSDEPTPTFGDRAAMMEDRASGFGDRGSGFGDGVPRLNDRATAFDDRSSGFDERVASFGDRSAGDRAAPAGAGGRFGDSEDDTSSALSSAGFPEDDYMVSSFGDRARQYTFGDRADDSFDDETPGDADFDDGLGSSPDSRSAPNWDRGPGREAAGPSAETGGPSLAPPDFTAILPVVPASSERESLVAGSPDGDQDPRDREANRFRSSAETMQGREPSAETSTQSPESGSGRRSRGKSLAEIRASLRLVQEQSSGRSGRSAAEDRPTGLEQLTGLESSTGLDRPSGREQSRGLDAPSGLEEPSGVRPSDLDGPVGLDRPSELDRPTGLEQPSGLEPVGRESSGLEPVGREPSALSGPTGADRSAASDRSAEAEPSGRRRARHAEPDDAPAASSASAYGSNDLTEDALARYREAAREQAQSTPSADAGLADLLAEALKAYEDGRRDQPENDYSGYSEEEPESNVAGITDRSRSRGRRRSTSDDAETATPARHRRAAMDSTSSNPRSWTPRSY